MEYSIKYKDYIWQYKTSHYEPVQYILYFEFHWSNLLKLFQFEIPSFEKIWSWFKSLTYGIPKDADLIWRYGTVCRNTFGDSRNFWQKFCDRIDEEIHAAKERKRLSGNYYVGWSFFDWTTGKQVTNMTQIHEIEKATGKQMVSWRDKEVEESKIQRQMVVDEKEKIKKKIHHVFSEVQKGRSYTKEIRADREAMRRQFQ